MLKQVSNPHTLCRFSVAVIITSPAFLINLFRHYFVFHAQTSVFYFCKYFPGSISHSVKHICHRLSYLHLSTQEWKTNFQLTTIVEIKTNTFCWDGFMEATSFFVLLFKPHFNALFKRLTETVVVHLCQLTYKNVLIMACQYLSFQRNSDRVCQFISVQAW